MNFNKPALAIALCLSIAGVWTIGTANAASPGLPVYPGAVASPGMSVIGPTQHCGHSMVIFRYLVTGASTDTIGDWYVQHIPGSLRVNLSQGGTTASTVLDPSGTHEAMSTNSKFFGKPSKNTMISLVTYHPPVPNSGMALMRQAAAGNRAAIAKVSQGCGVL